MELTSRIINLSDENLIWEFDGDPQFHIKGQTKDWGSYVKIDPFPCYSHNRELTQIWIHIVETKFSIGFPVTYYILPYESTDRCNGLAFKNTIYSRGEGEVGSNKFDPYIAFIGKRIPLHPAMTRYLIGHEYGHIVNYWIEYCRGDKDETVTGFDREYAKMRGLEPDPKTGSRAWHKCIGEIIANDCRICCFGIEREFWPHNELGFDCPHPDATMQVNDFWKELKEKYAYKVN